MKSTDAAKALIAQWYKDWGDKRCDHSTGKVKLTREVSEVYLNKDGSPKSSKQIDDFIKYHLVCIRPKINQQLPRKDEPTRKIGEPTSNSSANTKIKTQRIIQRIVKSIMQRLMQSITQLITQLIVKFITQLITQLIIKRKKTKMRKGINRGY